MDYAQRVSPLHRDDVARLGPYRLAGRLGAGGMGVVYLGLDPDDRQVAIKLVHAALAGDPEFRDRFRGEVERARQVPSFCTAEVLDADLDHNPPYLVVEYVDGPSLAQVVHERGPLTTANLHSVAVGVATALVGIHSAGVIHRDLKPENVLLAPGSPKVIDFGIARAFEVSREHTRTGQMVGTVAYMAPERFSARPGTPLTPAADIFAWGCVVGYGGTGQTPFQGDSPEVTAARILTQPPYLDGLAEPLRSLVELAVVKDPADRPTARELLDMLVSGAGTPAARPVRPRSPGLPPAVAAFLPPVESRPVEPRSSGLRPDVAAFQEPAVARPPTHRHGESRHGESRHGESRHGESRHGVSRPVGLRPEVAEFLEPSESLPDISGPVRIPPPRGWRSRLAVRVRGLRGNRWLAMSTVLLVVAGIVAVIGAGVWAGHGLFSSSPSADPARVGGAPTPSIAARQGAGPPSTLAEIVEPTGGRLILQDPLNRPGRWSESAFGKQKARCLIRAVLRVERIDRVEHGDYQCNGPDLDIADDFGVSVTVSLQSPSSCAAIWFYWIDGTGGYVLRVCAAGITLSTDREVLGTYPQGRPVPLKTATRIHLVARAGDAAVWQDGAYAGSVPLPDTGASDGQVRLGLSVENGDDPPPYAVTFAAVEITGL